MHYLHKVYPTFLQFRSLRKSHNQPHHSNFADEMNCPSKRACTREDKCKQLCITTSDGHKGCACAPGYILDPDNFTCNDINECNFTKARVHMSSCWQYINNHSYHPGTGLQPNLQQHERLLRVQLHARIRSQARFQDVQGQRCEPHLDLRQQSRHQTGNHLEFASFPRPSNVGCSTGQSDKCQVLLDPEGFAKRNFLGLPLQSRRNLLVRHFLERHSKSGRQWDRGRRYGSNSRKGTT